MIEDGLDYFRNSQNKNRLVFKGLRYQKVISYIFSFGSIIFGFIISYIILKGQLASDPTHEDYVVGQFFQ